MVPTASAAIPENSGSVTPDTATFPLVCPVCAASSGRPASVRSYGQDHVEVHIRCQSCAHEWAYLRRCRSLSI